MVLFQLIIILFVLGFMVALFGSAVDNLEIMMLGGLMMAPAFILSFLFAVFLDDRSIDTDRELDGGSE